MRTENVPFPQSGLPEHDIHIGDIPLRAEVVQTWDQIRIGMMGRVDVPDGTGMLFIFPDAGDGPRRFWMKNCPVDLDVAFFGSDRKLLNSTTMKAHDTRTRYESKGLAQFAVETRSGFFAEKDIGPGAVLHLPEAVLKLIEPDDD